MNIAGIDLGGTNVRVGLINESGLQQVNSVKIKSDGTVEDVLEAIFSLTDPVINNVQGIGIGVPSVVDLQSGTVYDVQNIPSWKEVQLKNIMENRYKIPVHINNDANCFAIGEKYFGHGRNYNNMAGLICGTGLGAGLILNGRLYSGANCGAGEFGMIPYLDSDYETYCSGKFFERTYEVSGEKLFELAQQGDENALGAFVRFGEHLGNAVKMILYAVDPELIVLGGSVSRAFKYFREPMMKTLQSFAYGNSVKRLRVEVSVLDHIAILGAASLVFDAAKE